MCGIGWFESGLYGLEELGGREVTRKTLRYLGVTLGESFAGVHDGDADDFVAAFSDENVVVEHLSIGGFLSFVQGNIDHIGFGV